MLLLSKTDTSFYFWLVVLSKSQFYFSIWRYSFGCKPCVCNIIPWTYAQRDAQPDFSSAIFHQFHQLFWIWAVFVSEMRTELSWHASDCNQLDVGFRLVIFWLADNGQVLLGEELDLLLLLRPHNAVTMVFVDIVIGYPSSCYLEWWVIHCSADCHVNQYHFGRVLSLYKCILPSMSWFHSFCRPMHTNQPSEPLFDAAT